MKNNVIDFVIPWVDGNDLEWKIEFNKYVPKNKLLNSEDRFRDWDNLQFIFRSFEKCTPWVNKIYLITYGHLPKWLNIHHEKLVIINHKDYLEKRYLPTFSSHPIEINLHKIEGLSEKFVYFNDDLFILKPLSIDEFFKNNLPVDFAISNIMHDGIISHIVMNDIDIINKNFNRHVGDRLTKRGIILKNFFKWFNLNYGIYCFPNLLLLYWKTFTGFLINHYPQPFLKSTFYDLWAKEEELLIQTSLSKFRDNSDVNQYLFRYWQLVSGKFYPGNINNMINHRKYIELRTTNDAVKIAQDIKNRTYKIYCINDSTSKGRYTKETMSDKDFNFSKTILNKALLEIFPEKSRFEI